jgi:cytosine/adenosine deaminase-related metal-dependent hydrolase
LIPAAGRPPGAHAPSPALLLRGATVLTLDPSASVLRGADLLVAGGRIAAVGDAVEAPRGTRVLELAGMLLLPGLVQGHLHLGQTLFRGLAEGRRLLDWLRQRIWPLESAPGDEEVYWGSMLGAAECLLGGTTTVQDIGVGPGARGLLDAFLDSGLRGFAGMCLMDSGEGAPPALLCDTDEALARTEELGRGFDGAADGRLRYVLNPRFILSCSDPLWAGVRQLSELHGWPVHTHALEQQEETATVRALKGGRDEVEYFADTGVLPRSLRIAHGVWIEPAHESRLREAGCSVVHCPSSNLKLGSGIADVVRLRAAGIAVGVGADGAACSNTLDALEEVRLAALLQKLTHGPASFGGLDALRLATSEGARALGMEDEIGSIAVGKRADLVAIALARPELAAAAAVDPHDLVAFGASRASVRHVLVGGELLVEDGVLTRLDLERVRAEAARCRAAVVARAGLA